MNISKTHMDISMSRVLKLILSLAILLGAACALWAQTPTPAAQIAGVIGEVKNIDMATNQMIVRAESGVLSTVILNEKPKYNDAKPSKFEEVKVNDQLRALGDKSADGTHLTAEEVVFGTFKIAGGTVTAIDAANNQIKINDLTTKKSLTIVFKPDSIIRR